jgi:SAM-dependent methyltransferase
MAASPVKVREILRGFTRRSSQHLLDYVHVLEQERSEKSPSPELTLPQQPFIRRVIASKLRGMAPPDRAAVRDYASYLRRCQRARAARSPIPANKRISWWSPTPQTVVMEALRLADLVPQDVLFDLGCGDGRVIVNAARLFGSRAVGFDIDRARVREARKRIRKAGVGDLVQVRAESILAIPDLFKATVVYVYLTQGALNRVIPILRRRCRPGTRIVSVDTWNRRWRPEKELFVRRLRYRWRVGLWYV